MSRGAGRASAATPAVDQPDDEPTDVQEQEDDTEAEGLKDVTDEDREAELAAADAGLGEVADEPEVEPEDDDDPLVRLRADLRAHIGEEVSMTIFGNVELDNVHPIAIDSDEDGNETVRVVLVVPLEMIDAMEWAVPE